MAETVDRSWLLEFIQSAKYKTSDKLSHSSIISIYFQKSAKSSVVVSIDLWCLTTRRCRLNACRKAPKSTKAPLTVRPFRRTAHLDQESSTCCGKVDKQGEWSYTVPRLQSFQILSLPNRTEHVGHPTPTKSMHPCQTEQFVYLFI